MSRGLALARRLSHGKNRAKMGHARSILGQKTGISFSGDQTLVGPDLVSGEREEPKNENDAIYYHKFTTLARALLQ